MANEKASFFARHEFLIRRLHSLSGLIPVGAYMVVHLLTNSSVLDGPATFQNAVYGIHSLGALLPVVEWTFIFIPILFHAIIGVAIIFSGQDNSTTYKYSGNVRYTLQRASGMIAFVFIMWHVFHMHGWFHFEAWLDGIAGPLGGAQFRAYNATSTVGAAMKNPIVVTAYVIGVLACVFHLANGIWTMGITWGVWVSPVSQKRATYVCAAFGCLLAIVALSAIGGFATVDVDQAEKIENEMYEKAVEAHRIAPNEHKRKHSAESAEDESKTTAGVAGK